eukprot:1387533-Rhodomonas_salina.3
MPASARQTRQRINRRCQRRTAHSRCGYRGCVTAPQQAWPHPQSSHALPPTRRLRARPAPGRQTTEISAGHGIASALRRGNATSGGLTWSVNTTSGPMLSQCCASLRLVGATSKNNLHRERGMGLRGPTRSWKTRPSLLSWARRDRGQSWTLSSERITSV